MNIYTYDNNKIKKNCRYTCLRAPMYPLILLLI